MTGKCQTPMSKISSPMGGPTPTRFLPKDGEGLWQRKIPSLPWRPNAPGCVAGSNNLRSRPWQRSQFPRCRYCACGTWPVSKTIRNSTFTYQGDEPSGSGSSYSASNNNKYEPVMAAGKLPFIPSRKIRNFQSIPGESKVYRGSH
jgi:hypothetical protein